VLDRSCDEEDEDEGEPHDAVSSPRLRVAPLQVASGRNSPAPPWIGNAATGRRSNRPRAPNDAFARRFAQDLKESNAANEETVRVSPTRETGLVAPVPRRPADAFFENPPKGFAAAPRAPLAATSTTAAELLIGSPGAGLAAADTLLMLLMTAGADAPDGTAPPSEKTVPESNRARGWKTASSETRLVEKKRTGASTGVPPKTEPKAAKRRKIVTGTELDERGVKRVKREMETYAGPEIVPATAMYDNAAAAARKRRMLPSRGGGRQKVHRPWTPPEVEALVEGVAHYGRGQWADIKSLQANGVAAALESRTAVDLKDKWRNLLRIAVLPVLYKRREATEVPPATLARVRELAARKGASPGGVGRAGETFSKGGGGDDASESGAMTASAPKGARRSKHHSPWTLTESEALVDGVALCAGCRWTVIKKLGLKNLERRTAMDLKDKWRNLLQLASLPSQSRRKAETPPDLLQRVLRLEAEFGVARRKGRKGRDGEIDE